MDILQAATPQAPICDPIVASTTSIGQSYALQEWSQDECLFIQLQDELLYATACLTQEPLVFHNDVTAHKMYLVFFGSSGSEDGTPGKALQDFIDQRDHLHGALLWRIQRLVEARARRTAPMVRNVIITPAILRQYRHIRGSIGFDEEVKDLEKESELWKFLSAEALEQYIAREPISTTVEGGGAAQQISGPEPCADAALAPTAVIEASTENTAVSGGEDIVVLELQQIESAEAEDLRKKKTKEKAGDKIAMPTAVVVASPQTQDGLPHVAARVVTKAPGTLFSKPFLIFGFKLPAEKLAAALLGTPKEPDYAPAESTTKSLEVIRHTTSDPRGSKAVPKSPKQARQNLKRPSSEDQVTGPIVKVFAPPASASSRKIAKAKGGTKSNANVKHKTPKLAEVTKAESESTRCPCPKKDGDRCGRWITEEMKQKRDFVCHNHRNEFLLKTKEEQQVVLTRDWEADPRPEKRLKLSDMVAEEGKEEIVGEVVSNETIGPHGNLEKKDDARDAE